MRYITLILLGLIATADRSFGASWLLQGSGNFEDPAIWNSTTNGGPNGVPAAGDTLQFYGGGGSTPMWNADVTLTLNSSRTIHYWDQNYWQTTVRLNLNGHDLTVTGAGLYSISQSDEANSRNTNHVYGGGTLSVTGFRSGGTGPGAFYLSGGSTKMVFIGDEGMLMGGSPGKEALFSVTGGAVVTNGTTWASTRVGGYYTTGIPVSAIVYLSDSGTRMDLNGGPLVIGEQGKGQLIVTNGATLKSAGNVNLGGWQYGGLSFDGTNGLGIVRVDGASVCEAGRFDVGMYSTGRVEVAGASTLRANTGVYLGIGYAYNNPGNGTNKAAFGKLLVTGASSTVHTIALEVGGEGKGEVQVLNNANLTASGALTLKNSKLTVSDAFVSGKTVTTAGSLNTIRIELGARAHTLAYLRATDAMVLTNTALELAVLKNFSVSVGETVRLLRHGSRSGTFANYANGDIVTVGTNQFQITYDTEYAFLTVLEPLSPLPALTFQRDSTNLTLSWSGTGFRLQSQTNALSVGISSNWFEYSGGSTSPVVVPISPLQPTAFFRLKSGISAGQMFPNYVPSVYYYGAGMRSNVTKTVVGNSIVVTANITNVSTLTYGQFGGFILPEIELGTNAFGYDFSGSGVLVPLSTAHTNEQLVAHYPRSYSPLLVVKNGDTLVCFSFHYPILNYKHETKLAISYRGNGKWQPSNLNTFFDYPTRPAGDYHAVSAFMAPGTVREYKMIITTGATLEEVLTPYKAYFTGLYPGGKQYTNDLTPMLGIPLAAGDTPGFPTTNPYGWYPNFANADVLGFEAVVKPEILRYTRGAPGDYNSGNDTFLIWTPDGCQEGDLEYPFKFTSKWADFTGSLSGTIATMRGLVTPGKRMGFWWGHSIEYQPNWNSAVGRTEFDWTNPTHRAAGHAEMTNAIAAGATFIGMDACAHGLGVNPADGTTDGHNQLWHILPWIQELKATYPGVKFITEGMASDLLHRETASYLEYWAWDYKKKIHGRHLLADILLPGSEIVGAIAYNIGFIAEPGLWNGQPFWAPINEEVRLNVIRTTANHGYVPVLFYHDISLKNDL